MVRIIELWEENVFSMYRNVTLKRRHMLLTSDFLKDGYRHGLRWFMPCRIVWSQVMKKHTLAAVTKLCITP